MQQVILGEKPFKTERRWDKGQSILPHLSEGMLSLSFQDQVVAAIVQILLSITAENSLRMVLVLIKKKMMLPFWSTHPPFGGLHGGLTMSET